MISEFYSLFSLLIVCAALFSYVNYRYLKLPFTIGIMVISLFCSILMVIAAPHFPGFVQHAVSRILRLDFYHLLMNVMLGFLLFAGAIHVDVRALKRHIVPIATLATVGVLLSTAVIGCTMYLILPVLGFPIPLIDCLLFGALISPTDPIAVLSVLQEAKIPRDLEIKIAGESLFNDGMAVVVFLSLLEIESSEAGHFSAGQIGLLFLREAGGGILWGLILGYAAFLLLRSIDNYKVEVLITLAVVMGGYAMASWIHVSGPLAMVVAGIITGNKAKKLAMSEITRDYLGKFWELIDEILNALLFLLMGFQMLVVTIDRHLIYAGIIGIMIVLLARLISVSLPVWLLSYHKTFEKHAIAILTWGGLRGGISIALALSIPEQMHREELLSITYAVVIFSILVQGLTVGKIARRLIGRKSAA